MYPQKVEKLLKNVASGKKRANLNVAAMARGDERLMKTLVAPEGHEFVGRDFCLHPRTELLTKKNGWVAVLDLAPTDEVWQVNPYTLNGSWVKPTRLIKRYYEGKMFSFGNRRGSLHVTENHTMLWAGQFHKVRKDKELFRKITLSQEGVENTNQNMLFGSETTGFRSEYTLKDLELICAIQADGSYTKNKTYDIQVSKPRKREILRGLLGPGKVSSEIRPGQTLPVERWHVSFTHELLEPGKEKNINVEKLGDNQIQDFLSCLSNWDSYKLGYKTKRFTYATTNIELANRIQARIVRSGAECHMCVMEGRTPDHKNCARLSIKPLRARLRLRKSDIKEYAYAGMVGCVTVHEGFILVRSEGQTFVTGNCSLEPSVTAEFSKDPMYTYATQTGIGKKPYWDDKLNILMVDDIYQMYGSKTSFMGSEYKTAWMNNNFFDLWMTDAESIKKSELIEPHRKFSKVVVLGVERGMGARKLKNDAKEKAQKDISLQIARTAIKEFWEVFEGVKALKDKLSHIATVHGAFTTPLGFRVPCDDYKAYPFFTQAVGNDVLMLYRQYYMELAPWSHPITPIHDELVTWRPIDKREQDQAAHREALTRVNETLKWDTALRMTESYGKTFWDIK